jgi:mercuric ion transport protein
MNKEPSSKGAITTGIVAAIAASSCCIPPVIAAIAGVSGASASLAWIEPFRSYLIALTVVAIGYAWYSHFKPKTKDDCGCDIEKPRFSQTKGFLIGMTLFAIISISFPYYSGILLMDNIASEDIVVEKENISKTTLSIEGMTCNSCENHIKHAVFQSVGIIEVNVSYLKENATIVFDNSKTSSANLIILIENKTGYKVTDELKEK